MSNFRVGGEVKEIIMAKVIYEREIGVGILGELKYTVIPTCPVCGEVTYSEDTCPFCRMNGVLTELEYDVLNLQSFLTKKERKRDA